MLSTKFQVNWAFGSEEVRKIDFQNGSRGSHLGFPIGTILAIFDLQVTPSFKSIGLSVHEKKRKHRLSRWPPWPSWIADRNDFIYFWSTSHPDASYQVSSQMGLWFRRRSGKYIFKMAAMAATLNFRSERFSLTLIYKSPWCFLPSFESVGPVL